MTTDPGLGEASTAGHRQLAAWLSEPAMSLTDLALGIAVALLALVLRSQPWVARPWHRMFWWTAASALAGFVHHGWVTFSDALADPGNVIVSAMIITAMSYLLAASVHEVLGPGRQGTFWALRLVALAAYVALAVAGRPGIASLVLAESVTMAIVVLLWAKALATGHPMARGVVVALAASAVAAVATLLPERLTDRIGLDPVSLYHLAQIPGMVLLALALIGRPPASIDHDVALSPPYELDRR